MKSDPTCFIQPSHKIISAQRFDARGKSHRFYDKVISLEMFSRTLRGRVKFFLPHSSEEVFTFNPIRVSESHGHFLSYDPSKDALVNKRTMTSRSLAAWSWSWSVSRKPGRLSCGFSPSFEIKAGGGVGAQESSSLVSMMQMISFWWVCGLSH